MKKLKGYLKKMKKGIFYEAFDSVKKKPKLYLLIFLMDVVFLSVSYLIGRASNVLAAPIMASQNFVVLNAFIPAYIFLIVLVYSFTKYSAVHFVKNMFNKAKLNLKKIGWFYLLNLILFAFAFATLMLLVAVLKGGVREEYLSWAARISAAVWFFFVYALVSAAHSLFVLDFSFKDSLKNCFVISFGKIKKYYGVYLTSIGVLGAYFAIYYAVGFIVGNIFTLNAMRFNITFFVLSFIMIYVLAAYNRIYFYLITKSVMKK